MEDRNTKKYKEKEIRNAKYVKILREKATDEELLFKDYLDLVGIKYIFQKGFIANNFHCIVDFYLPKPYKVCIEVDGGYHDNKMQIIKDKRRDEYLKSRYFSVVHIKNKELVDDFEHIKKELDKILVKRYGRRKKGKVHFLSKNTN